MKNIGLIKIFTKKKDLDLFFVKNSLDTYKIFQSKMLKRRVFNKISKA